MAADFKASVADILKSRVRTSGIVEEIYRIDGVEFVMYDVGGQRYINLFLLIVFSLMVISF